MYAAWYGWNDTWEVIVLWLLKYPPGHPKFPKMYILLHYGPYKNNQLLIFSLLFYIYLLCDEVSSCVESLMPLGQM